jgi:hypothetical protein
VSAATLTPTDFAADFEARRERRLSEAVRSYPRNQPIASDVEPASCLRRQVLEVTAWESKEPIPTHRQARLEAGIEAEQQGIAELRRLGYTVIHQQSMVTLKHRRTGKPAARGKIDGKLQLEDGQKVKFEIKSMNPNVYARVDGLSDLERFWWTAKYEYQMQVYLIGDTERGDADWGVFLLTDLLGHWRPIVVPLDLQKAEAAWAFAEQACDAIEAALAGSELPQFSRRPQECTRCPFFGRACQPPIQNASGLSFIEDAELEADILRWSELRAPHSEYEALDRKVKAALKAPLPATDTLSPKEERYVTCGDFVATATLRERNEKAREARTLRFYEVEIERLGKPEAER